SQLFRIRFCLWRTRLIATRLILQSWSHRELHLRGGSLSFRIVLALLGCRRRPARTTLPSSSHCGRRTPCKRGRLRGMYLAYGLPLRHRMNCSLLISNLGRRDLLLCTPWPLFRCQRKICLGTKSLALRDLQMLSLVASPC